MNEEEFWSMAMPITETGCLIWMGKSTNGGYGLYGTTKYGDRKKNIRAHRLAWELTHGPIEDGPEVCHKCDVPPCINPDHLFLGTHHENMKDMSAKGRAERGERHHNAKLTSDEVIKIVKEYENGASVEFLAIKYEVWDAAISRILTGKRWQWLTGIKTKTLSKGERRGSTKIRPSQVDSIKQQVSQGLSQKEIADKYGVHQSTISRLLT